MSLRSSHEASGRGRRGPRWSLASELLTLAFFAYFLLPLFWLFVASTKATSDLFSSFGLWFADDFHLVQNIRDLLAVRTLDGGTYLVWILLFSRVGLTNNPLSIILPSAVSPFGVYLMRIYAEAAVPSELIEAARLDGASELRIFRSIALRLLAPGFVTVMIFAFVATWNNYFLPVIMLSEPKWYPLTVGIRQLGTTGTIIGSLLAVAPMILAFVFLQRYWQSGLSAGGVNG